ncbi:conserved hypothetical protein [Coccidioides posadasii str. Silveira]|uniref:Uncharacterized protein n=1 Tax=Coccidioides posadasii (strain RMSCC 757 / Silveira) TaxID=443226 RepID=E9DJN1_COCPS|nr:conserved hypothetical protein [Coccidioides posadasii str. Silveira]
MAEGTTGSYATMLLGEDKRIVVHSHIFMPSPGTANASWFDSRDATLFIERFYQMCKDHGVIDPKNIIEWLARYCVTWIGEWMKTLEGYKEVQANERLNEFTKVSWFLQGLPEKLQNKYEGNKKVFKEDEMKQKEMEKLGEQYQLANKPPTVEAPKKTASFVKTEESELKAKAKSSDSANIEAAIEKMTNEFTNLALAMRSMEEDEWVIPESTSPKKKINQQEEIPSANSISMKVQAGWLAYLMSDEESDSDKKYEPLEERTSVNIGTVGEAKNNQRAKIAMPHTQCTGQFITYWDNQASVDDNVMEDVEPIN